MENVNWGQLFFYEDLISYAKYLISHYPNLATYEVIGRSLDGRDIVLLIVGRGMQKIALTAGVHGRESINPMVMISMLEYYLEECPEYLEQVTLYAVPLVNPDGYTVALRGFDSIKNKRFVNRMKQTKLPFYDWKFNARGMDINRNFPAHSWKRKFTGDCPASEPETVALMRLFMEYPFMGYIDYHSRGNEIYYYRNALPKEYNKEQKRIADLLSALTDYKLVPPAEETEAGDSGGNTVHYFSEHYKKPAITIETLPDEVMFPLSPLYQREVFEVVKMTPFVFCKDK